MAAAAYLPALDREVELGIQEFQLHSMADDTSSVFTSDSDGASEDGNPSRYALPKFLVVIAVAAVAVLAVGGYVVSGRSSQGAEVIAAEGFAPRVKAEVLATTPTPKALAEALPQVTRSQAGEVGQTTLASSVPATASVSSDMPTSGASSSPVEPSLLAAFALANTSAMQVNARRSPKSLKPHEHMHDGNVCDDTEELYAGLCYTKCATLTGGTHPFRSTAFSCCATSSCSGMKIFRLKTASIIACNGYDVSSAAGGKACPHVPGTCLTDEEQFAGECFETCRKLTDGSFPNRVGPATCCKTEGVMCLDPFKDWTSNAFDVGGGKGDGDAQTPRHAHFPLKSLTEAHV